ncbi:alanine racemase [Ignavigranum ruoffiae]|uniref:Alanine racemase n=1 Tax=Ignavigranum ruoffiae TaxID=89093 RepID=A0A1H9FHS2_9LACT|nr:alanine racemase [Ignavigranum ruoffiae]SEQ37464.1 alanine racemase [Ignavigranum ruoffiae]
MKNAYEHRPTEAIVDLDALNHNIEVIQQRMKEDQKLYAVVKADAYGHGAVPIAKAAIRAGAQGLAVATVDEAIHLRKNGIDQLPILVLGLTDPRGVAEILLYQISITVSHLDFFEQAYQQLQATDHLDLLDQSKLNFHLALDTGMTRIGLRSKAEIQEFAEGISAYPWAEWEGVFTHFSTIGGGPAEYVEHQWEHWQDLLTAVPESVSLRHYANSAMGLWQKRQPQSDIIRYGISMYGLDPKDQYPAPDPLQPILSLVSEIVYVKEVEAGTRISYGATYTSSDTEWIATIPIGYADGWLRHYHKLPILVDGQACPVVGVINMDQLMIRLPKYYPVGTTVTLIGRDGQLENHASQMAKEINTIGYEILTSISKRVPRVYIQEGDQS